MKCRLHYRIRLNRKFLNYNTLKNKRSGKKTERFLSGAKDLSDKGNLLVKETPQIRKKPIYYRDQIWEDIATWIKDNPILMWKEIQYLWYYF